MPGRVCKELEDVRLFASARVYKMCTFSCLQGSRRYMPTKVCKGLEDARLLTSVRVYSPTPVFKGLEDVRLLTCHPATTF